MGKKWFQEVLQLIYIHYSFKKTPFCLNVPLYLLYFIAPFQIRLVSSQVGPYKQKKNLQLVFPAYHF